MGKTRAVLWNTFQRFLLVLLFQCIKTIFTTLVRLLRFEVSFIETCSSLKNINWYNNWSQSRILEMKIYFKAIKHIGKVASSLALATLWLYWKIQACVWFCSSGSVSSELMTKASTSEVSTMSSENVKKNCKLSKIQIIDWVYNKVECNNVQLNY